MTSKFDFINMIILLGKYHIHSSFIKLLMKVIYTDIC